jgi:hypothetical protein
MTQVPPSESKSRGSERHSQATLTNTAQESGHKTPSNVCVCLSCLIYVAHPVKLDGGQPKQVCFDWLHGRCRRPACRYPHEHPNDVSP